MHAAYESLCIPYDPMTGGPIAKATVAVYV